MAIIKNPVLRGFNPDPAIVRVGDDYYIATSTFQWWPGVEIHHSKDLVHWHTVAYPLNRVSQLDMRGEKDSHGIWAPCISYHSFTKMWACRFIYYSGICAQDLAGTKKHADFDYFTYKEIF